MIENIISKRYAEALSASIDDEGLLHRALGNLKAFREAFDADRQLGRFFSHPGISGKNPQKIPGPFLGKASTVSRV